MIDDGGTWCCDWRSIELKKCVKISNIETKRLWMAYSGIQEWSSRLQKSIREDLFDKNSTILFFSRRNVSFLFLMRVLSSTFSHSNRIGERDTRIKSVGFQICIPDQRQVESANLWINVIYKCWIFGWSYDIILQQIFAVWNTVLLRITDWLPYLQKNLNISGRSWSQGSPLSTNSSVNNALFTWYSNVISDCVLAAVSPRSSFGIKRCSRRHYLSTIALAGDRSSNRVTT